MSTKDNLETIITTPINSCSYNKEKFKTRYIGQYDTLSDQYALLNNGNPTNIITLREARSLKQKRDLSNERENSSSKMQSSCERLDLLKKGWEACKDELPNHFSTFNQKLIKTQEDLGKTYNIWIKNKIEEIAEYESQKSSPKINQSNDPSMKNAYTNALDKMARYDNNPTQNYLSEDKIESKQAPKNISKPISKTIYSEISNLLNEIPAITTIKPIEKSAISTSDFEFPKQIIAPRHTKIISQGSSSKPKTATISTRVSQSSNITPASSVLDLHPSRNKLSTSCVMNTQTSTNLNTNTSFQISASTILDSKETIGNYKTQDMNDYINSKQILRHNSLIDRNDLYVHTLITNDGNNTHHTKRFDSHCTNGSLTDDIRKTNLNMNISQARNGQRSVKATKSQTNFFIESPKSLNTRSFRKISFTNDKDETSSFEHLIRKHSPKVSLHPIQESISGREIEKRTNFLSKNELKLYLQEKRAMMKRMKQTMQAHHETLNLQLKKLSTSLAGGRESTHGKNQHEPPGKELKTIEHQNVVLKEKSSQPASNRHAKEKENKVRSRPKNAQITNIIPTKVFLKKMSKIPFNVSFITNTQSKTPSRTLKQSLDFHANSDAKHSAAAQSNHKLKITNVAKSLHMYVLSSSMKLSNQLKSLSSSHKNIHSNLVRSLNEDVMNAKKKNRSGVNTRNQNSRSSSTAFVEFPNSLMPPQYEVHLVAPTFKTSRKYSCLHDERIHTSEV